MAEHTNIEWADATLNFWMGCTKVSLGCKNCYADTITSRYNHELWGPKNPRKFVVSTMQTLRKIKKRVEAGERSKNGTTRLMVFVNDFADTFEDFTGPVVVPDGSRLWYDPDRSELFTQPVLTSRHREGRHATLDDLRRNIWDVVENNSDVIFQLLTKRIENVMRMVPESWHKCFPGNVWIGTSVEDQKAADERIHRLLKIPATVRFLSCEPQIGFVSLEPLTPANSVSTHALSGMQTWPAVEGLVHVTHTGDHHEDLPRIDWVICGGESGPNARPMHPDWARSLRDQCQAAGVPFFFKQWGEWQNGSQRGKPHYTVLSDGRYGESYTMQHGWADTHQEWHRLSPTVMAMVGKKAAGRILDGRTHDAFPQVTVNNGAYAV